MLLILFAIGSLVALTFLRISGKTLSDFYDHSYQVTVALADARKDMQAVRADIFKSILEPDAQATLEILEQADEKLCRVSEQRIPLIREHFRGDLVLCQDLEQIKMSKFSANQLASESTFC